MYVCMYMYIYICKIFESIYRSFDIIMSNYLAYSITAQMRTAQHNFRKSISIYIYIYVYVFIYVYVYIYIIY